MEIADFTCFLSGMVRKNVMEDVTEILSTNCIYHSIAGVIGAPAIGKVRYVFNTLNGVTAYSGVTEHKKLLLNEILNAAKKHGIKLKREDFCLKIKLERDKVFVNKEPLLPQIRLSKS